jgi:arylsulfatase A
MKAFIPTRILTLSLRVVVVSAMAVLSALGITELYGSDGKPNIVFILADDLGWNGIGCYGNELVATPNIDRLAAEGMKFTDAYVLSQCLPTRAALFSGQDGARTRLTSVETASPQYTPMISPGRAEGLPRECYTLFEMLRDAGYATGMSGKWHIGKDYSTEQLLKRHGIDYFHDYGFQYVGACRSEVADKKVTAVTDDMLTFIEQQRDKSFVAYLAHHSVHTPFEVPDELVEKYVAQGYRRSSSPEGVFAERVAADYLAMIDHLDQSVGRVIDKLDELDLASNTLVIFLSDNGGLTRVWNNDPLRGGKGQLYEGGLRVPLIVRWPRRVQAGATCRTPVHVVDFFPTFMEIVGRETKVDQKLDGVSLMPVLQQTGSLNRDAIYSHHPEYVVALAKTPCSMIRKGDYKLIHYFGDYLDSTDCEPKAGTLSGRFILGSKNELFNLAVDVSEQHDLSAEMPEKVAELMSDLRAWWKETDAQFPSPNPHMDRSQWIWNKE